MLPRGESLHSGPESCDESLALNETCPLGAEQFRFMFFLKISFSMWIQGCGIVPFGKLWHMLEWFGIFLALYWEHICCKNVVAPWEMQHKRTILERFSSLLI